MAVTGSQVAGQIQLAAPAYSGVDWAAFTQLIGNAVSAWLPSCQTQGVTVGTAGGGSVVGNLLVPPNPGPMVAAFHAGGLRGVGAPGLATAIANGLSAALTASGQYAGASAGVGTGSDTSFVVSAPGAVLTGLILSQGTTSGFRGVDLPSLANAIGTGASSLLLTATGTGVVTGSGSPTAATGTSTGALF